MVRGQLLFSQCNIWPKCMVCACVCVRARMSARWGVWIIWQVDGWPGQSAFQVITVSQSLLDLISVRGPNADVTVDFYTKQLSQKNLSLQRETWLASRTLQHAAVRATQKQTWMKNLPRVTTHMAFRSNASVRPSLILSTQTHALHTLPLHHPISPW